MDCEIRRNVFHHGVNPPYVTGCDAVGTVVWTSYDEATKVEAEIAATGGRPKVRLGDRVCAVGLRGGGNARYVAVSASRVVPVPPDLDGAQVACLIRAYAPARQCLIYGAKWEAMPDIRGKRVLVIGGSGALGQAVADLAKVMGARCVILTGNRGREDKYSEVDMSVVRMGSDVGSECQLFRLGRDPKLWRSLVEGQVDIAIDCVGLDSHHLSVDVLSKFGKLVVVGALSCAESTTFSPLFGQSPEARLNIFSAAHLIERAMFYDLFQELHQRFEQYQADLLELFGLLREGKIRPKVRRIPLSEVIHAHHVIEKGGTVDNTILVCTPFGATQTDDCIGRDLSLSLSVERQLSHPTMAKSNPVHVNSSKGASQSPSPISTIVRSRIKTKRSVGLRSSEKREAKTASFSKVEELTKRRAQLEGRKKKAIAKSPTHLFQENEQKETGHCISGREKVYSTKDKSNSVENDPPTQQPYERKPDLIHTIESKKSGTQITGNETKKGEEAITENSSEIDDSFVQHPNQEAGMVHEMKPGPKRLTLTDSVLLVGTEHIGQKKEGRETSPTRRDTEKSSPCWATSITSAKDRVLVLNGTLENTASYRDAKIEREEAQINEQLTLTSLPTADYLFKVKKKKSARTFQPFVSIYDAVMISRHGDPYKGVSVCKLDLNFDHILPTDVVVMVEVSG